MTKFSNFLVTWIFLNYCLHLIFGLYGVIDDMSWIVYLTFLYRMQIALIYNLQIPFPSQARSSSTYTLKNWFMLGTCGRRNSNGLLSWCHWIPSEFITQFHYQNVHSMLKSRSSLKLRFLRSKTLSFLFPKYLLYITYSSGSCSSNVKIYLTLYCSSNNMIAFLFTLS